MKIYQDILSNFIGIILLKIDTEGNILNITIDTKGITKNNPPKTVYKLFSKEDKFRIDRILSTGYSGKKKYFELYQGYGKGQYVDVSTAYYDKELYMYIQMFESERERAVMYDRYVEKLATIAEKDVLTKVLNRHGLWESVKSIVTNVDPERRIGIVYMDVDNLKHINDTYGHESGDKLILKITEILKSTVRHRDIVTRYGGDEFVIVVQEYSGKTSTAYGLAQRLKRHIEEIKGKYASTASFGVHITKVKNLSKYKDDEKALEQAWKKELEKADMATYKSKEAGKNTISTSSEYKRYY
ncbi:MAG: GGDEF domain-containing protein [Candidatus Dojkabacteria bacterium]|nr:GGDEF domain-containing protein [Candidatus Dojkabacteria bacterium]